MIRQRWRDLLFLHWPLPAQLVRPLLPAGLELDCHHGSAWITLIPFLIAESRPAALPALSMSFLETNLRTYVRGPDGEPGIHFFSLEAASRSAVVAARLCYGLPYFHAVMSRRVDGPRITYASRRRGATRATIEVEWTVGAPREPAAPGGRDHFLIERYCLYVRRRGRLRRGRVRHSPYPLRDANVDRLQESLLAAVGLPAPAGAPLCHHSPGVDVEIGALEAAEPRGGGA
ncbi:MAG TPA: DUF2071 domain-containing protein [Verrucomicrobiae bacterium]|nr:DUF2071 domain-containing protein [Verrucomicrobiae bacterium]